MTKTKIKTYDDMVLEYPILAWVYWMSVFASGMLLCGISLQFPQGILLFALQGIGLILIAYAVFSLTIGITAIGDALGFTGDFEKRSG